ncbi:hypothetical protein FACS1894116_12030 [Betaproteobacteria bacterium]|nr:hypothetical protein FACS1894116_12030 [Betaproteobacteria bacterium]
MKKLLNLIAFALAVFLAPLAQAVNYTDGWWNPELSGMGLNIIHGGDTVALTWYHYDDSNKPVFLVVTGKLNGDTLSGKLYRSTGTPPALYDASAHQQTAVGEATLTFNSDNEATFTYNYDGKPGSFDVERFPVGGAGAATSPNYTAGWWNPGLSGMGLNVIHGGDTVALTWYHYDNNNISTFLVASGKLNGDTLNGKLYRSTGTPPALYDASAHQQTEVGEATLTFNSDNEATFAYNYDGKPGSFKLERFVVGDTGGAESGKITGKYAGPGKIGSSCGGFNITAGKYTLSITDHGDGSYTLNTPSLGVTYFFPKLTVNGNTYSADVSAGGTSTSGITLSSSGFSTSPNKNKVYPASSCQERAKMASGKPKAERSRR